MNSRNAARITLISVTECYLLVNFKLCSEIFWPFISSPINNHLDGVMIQLLPEKMMELKEALKAVEDFRISCSQSSPIKHVSENSEQNAVSLQCENTRNF